MSQLAKNVWRMENVELIGLAKNRFLDEATQVKIAEHPYRRAKQYLAENAGLCQKALAHLWSLRGYSLKADLLSFGHFAGQDEFYHELYDDYATQMRQRSPWRLHRAFVGGHGYNASGYGPLTGPRATPPEILEDIYQKDVMGRLDLKNESWSQRTTLRALLANPNLPTDIIVKVSASHADPGVRNLALKRLGTLK